MKKSTYVSLILGTLEILLLGLGMCMCLLPEWNLFNQGIVMGAVGLIVLFIMILVYRRMEQMTPIHINGKTILLFILCILGILCFGAGMSISMVYEQILLGSCIGIVGILLLLGLLPFCIKIK